MPEKEIKKDGLNTQVIISKEVYEIDPSKIKIDFRQREMKNVMANIEDLKRSIKSLGQLMPGLCFKRLEDDSEHETEIVLIFGQRRLMSCKSLGVPFRYQLVSYKDMEEFNQWILKRIELEENLCRVPLTWKEEVDAIKEIDSLYTTLYGEKGQGGSTGHSIQDTAILLGVSRSKISEAIKLSLWKDKVPQVAQATNLNDAKKIMRKLEAVVKTKEKIKELKQERTKTKEDKSYSSQYFNSTFEDFVQTHPDRRFDIIIIDPPWRVDFSSVTTKAKTEIKTYDDSKEGLPELKKQIQLCYDVLEENGHLYLFFGIVNYAFIYESLKEIGFRTNGIPLISRKRGAARTRNPDLYPGRCWGPIAFAVKGKKDLIQKGKEDYIEAPYITQSKDNIHPSAVHPSVFINLVTRSAKPGDKILDPMCGSGFSALAFQYYNQKAQPIEWTCIEKEEVFYNQGLERLTEEDFSFLES